MLGSVLLLLAVVLFFLAVAGYVNRSLYGDLNFSPPQLLLAAAVLFLSALSLEAGLSLPAFFLLLLAVFSAYKVFDSFLYGDISWGFLLLFLLASALLLAFSAQEIAGLLEPAMYINNSANTNS